MAALLRAAVPPLRAVRMRGTRGFKTSLDWVKAGCPGPVEEAAVAAPRIAAPKISSTQQAMIEQAGSAGAGVLSGMFGSQSLFVPYVFALLAAAKTFELLYLPENEYQPKAPPEAFDAGEEEEFAKESRYGGVIAPGDVGLKRTRSLFEEKEEEEGEKEDE